MTKPPGPVGHIPKTQGVVGAFAGFYVDLYASKRQGEGAGADEFDPGPDVPEVEAEEVRAQLTRMARGTAADGSGIVAEMLKDGGDKLVTLLAEVYSDVLAAQQEPPES